MYCPICGKEMDCVLRCYATVIVDRVFPSGDIQSCTQRDDGPPWHECESCGNVLPAKVAEKFVE